MKLASLLTISLCLMSTLPAADTSTLPIFENLKAGKPQTVVVYGTSLTAGGAWVASARKWFDAEYPGLVAFVNSGGSGMNSDWGVQKLQEKVLNHKPDLVFIEFAINDAHEKFKMPVQKGASNLDQIVRGIRESNPQAAIVLQVMNPVWDANERKSSSSRPEYLKYMENYRVYAREKNLPLLDHYVVWEKIQKSEPEKFKKYIPDGTHPTNEASVLVTWATVKDWLEKSRDAAK